MSRVSLWKSLDFAQEKTSLIRLKLYIRILQTITKIKTGYVTCELSNLAQEDGLKTNLSKHTKVSLGWESAGWQGCRCLLCRRFWGGSARQFDSTSGPRLLSASGSAGSGNTAIFAPLVSLPHGKGCPQHRGATGSRLETPLLYPGLLLRLLSICCLAAQSKAFRTGWFHSGEGSSQVQREENWRKCLRDAVLPTTCSSDQQCELLLESSTSSVALLDIFWAGISPGLSTYAHKQLMHSSRSEVSTREHWDLEQKTLCFVDPTVYWWSWNTNPRVSYLPFDAFLRRGETHPQESSETAISAFQFCTALSQQAHKAFAIVCTV